MILTLLNAGISVNSSNAVEPTILSLAIWKYYELALTLTPDCRKAKTWGTTSFERSQLGVRLRQHPSSDEEQSSIRYSFSLTHLRKILSLFRPQESGRWECVCWPWRCSTRRAWRWKAGKIRKASQGEDGQWWKTPIQDTYSTVLEPNLDLVCTVMWRGNSIVHPYSVIV